MQPKPTETAQPEPERDRDYSSRLHGAISSSIFSIGDLFRDGQKGVRFPKDLIKVLEQKLQDIAMGKDAAYVFLSFAIAASEMPEVEREYRARPRFFHNILKPPLRALPHVCLYDASAERIETSSRSHSVNTDRTGLAPRDVVIGRERSSDPCISNLRAITPRPCTLTRRPLLLSPSAICVVRELGQLDMVPRSGQFLPYRLRVSLPRTLFASHLEP